MAIHRTGRIVWRSNVAFLGGPMLSYIENPNAYVEWCLAQRDPARRTVAIIEVFADDSWLTQPLCSLRLLGTALNEPSTRDEMLGLRANLVERIEKHDSLDPFADALIPLFGTYESVASPEANPFALWIAAHAQPNDALIVSDVVDNIAFGLPDQVVDATARALVEWMFTKGSSELRSPRRGALVARLVQEALCRQWHDLLPAALRFLLYHPENLDFQHYLLGEQLMETLAAAVERLLEQNTSATCVGDVGGALSPAQLNLYAQVVLGRWDVFPLSRADIVKRLSEGGFEVESITRAWARVVAGPPIATPLGSAGVAEHAIAGLAELLTSTNWPFAFEGEGRLDRSRTQWAEQLTREYLRTTQVLETKNSKQLDLLDRLFRGDTYHLETLEGVLSAFRAAAAELEDQVAVNASALLQGDVAPTVVRAVIHLLRDDKGAKPLSANPGIDLEEVLELLRMMLSRGAQPFGGFDLAATTQGATDVAVRELQNDWAFQVEDGTLLFDQGRLESACRPFEGDERRAIAVLFALHELVHDAQGIAAKKTVHDVRFAGAESALMHMDIGADHVAASVAHEIFPDWPLLWLKDLQGKSLVAFPASKRHPQFARLRKTLRLVGLRADYLLRKLEIAVERFAPPSYGFVDFGPGGGSIVFLVNRPPFQVVRVAPLSPKDASTLFEGVDGQPGAIERIDEGLARALEGMESPEQPS